MKDKNLFRLEHIRDSIEKIEYLARMLHTQDNFWRYRKFLSNVGFSTFSTGQAAQTIQAKACKPIQKFIRFFY